jgi:hypothetical protein
MPMSATNRNTTPAAKLMSRKAMISRVIHRARARFPNIVKVFGNSMVSLIFVSPSGVIVS